MTKAGLKTRNTALAAALCACTLFASAAERTVMWSDGENPPSVLDGDVAFTYQSGLIQNVTLDPKGDTIVFSGDKMNCVDPDRKSGTDKTSTWSFKSKGKVVFRNAFQARSMTCKQASGFVKTANVTWKGYSTLLPTNGYQVVVEKADLKDWDPVDVKQDASVEPGSATTVNYWLNAPCTMLILKTVREGDRIFVQYRSATAYEEGSRKRYYVAKVEFLQIGADIGARLVGGWTVYFTPGAGSVIETGSFDMDEIDIGDDKVVRPARVTGPAAVNGIGMNTLTMKFVGADVLMCFEGTTDFTGSTKPMTGVRMEIADASKSTKTAYATPTETGVLAFQNGGENWTMAKMRASQTGAQNATFLFESTRATASASVTNVYTLSSAITTDSKFAVAGISGSPAVLTVNSLDSLPTNSSVTARSGGIIRLWVNCPWSSALSDYKAYKAATTEFVAEPGGIIEQCATNVFSSPKQAVRLNGGKLVLGCRSPKSTIPTDLFKLYLRDGASLEVANGANRNLRFGNVTNGCCWSIGGSMPSTNNVSLEVYGPRDFENPHVFNVSKTGNYGADYEADFVQNGKIMRYTGTINFAAGSIRKTGDGTMLLNGDYTPWGKTYVDRGTLKIGKSNLWRKHGNEAADRISPLVLNGGTLAAKACTTNTLGMLTLAADSAIVAEEGAVLDFSDVKDDWTAGKILNVSIPVDPSSHELLATVRFSMGITDAQLAQIRLNGRPAGLDSKNALTKLGFVFIIK